MGLKESGQMWKNTYEIFMEVQLTFYFILFIKRDIEV